MNTYVFSAHSFEKRQTLYFKLTTTPVQTEAIVYVTEGIESTFADSDSIAEYAREAVNCLVEYSILNGFDDNTVIFQPGNIRFTGAAG